MITRVGYNVGTSGSMLGICTTECLTSTFPRQLSVMHELKCGKVAGVNGIPNEFLFYGTSEILVEALHILFDLMLTTGVVPADLSTALLIPIPKSKDIAAPSDYRPISVSTLICTLLELLLRQRMPFLEEQNPNQFGYKKATSCKSAYYVVN